MWICVRRIILHVLVDLIFHIIYIQWPTLICAYKFHTIYFLYHENWWNRILYLSIQMSLVIRKVKFSRRRYFKTHTVISVLQITFYNLVVNIMFITGWLVSTERLCQETDMYHKTYTITFISVFRITSGYFESLAKQAQNSRTKRIFLTK